MGTVSRLSPRAAFSLTVAILAFEVIFGGELGAHRIATALAARADQSGVVRATYAELASATGMNRRTVERVIPQLLASGVLARVDERPYLYRWDLVKLNDAAARNQSSKVTVSQDRDGRSGLTHEEREACEALRSALAAAATAAYQGTHLRARAYVAPRGSAPGGFYRLETARQVGGWIVDACETCGTDLESVAAHLAATYVQDSRERERSGHGEAWSKGLPIDWISQVLERAASTMRVRRRPPVTSSASSASSSVASAPPSSSASVALGAAAVLRAVGGAS